MSFLLGGKRDCNLTKSDFHRPPPPSLDFFAELKGWQEKAVENMKTYGVVPQAWGPLAEGKHGIFTDPELTEIGNKYGKTAAQVVLRWNAQRGVSIIPKSVRVERMQQNIDIWDFSLTEEEMAKVAAKDLGHSEIVNHDDPMFIKFCVGALKG